MAVLPDDVIAAAKELESLRHQTSVLRRREETLRTKILQALDGDEKGLTASGVAVVHVQVQTRRKVSSAKLEALYPEIYDQVMSESTVKVLKIDLDD
jgi:RNA-binding protein YlmH